jgi:hypothetical protein
MYFLPIGLYRPTGISAWTEHGQGKRTKAIEGGAPGLSTVYLIQNPNDSFHPIGSGISHLSKRNGSELMLETHRQNCVRYAIYAESGILVILPPGAHKVISTK